MLRNTIIRSIQLLPINVVNAKPGQRIYDCCKALAPLHMQQPHNVLQNKRSRLLSRNIRENLSNYSATGVQKKQ